MEIRKRGIIKQVIYFTDNGFADKLGQLFIDIQCLNPLNNSSTYKQEQPFFELEVVS